MPLPDILQFIGLGRKTGLLKLQRGGARKTVVFDAGKVVFCSSGSSKEYLGQQLLARTGVTEEELAGAFEEQERTNLPLGEVIVGRGLLTPEELQTVLSRKVADSLYELFTWPAASFTFHEQPLTPRDAPVRIALDWQDATMEGCRRTDEMALIRQVIPGPGVRFHAMRSHFPPGFPRTSGDKKLVELVDAGLTVGEICPRFHASDFDILSRLRVLLHDGILRVDEVSLAEARVPDATRAVRNARKLANDGALVEALDLLREAHETWPEEAEIPAELEALEADIRNAYARVGGMEAVPALVGGLEALTRLQLSSKAGFVASRVTGSWSTKTIAQLCPFPEVDVLATLVQLARRGVLEITRQPAGVGH